MTQKKLVCTPYLKKIKFAKIWFRLEATLMKALWRSYKVLKGFFGTN